ncbi:transposase, partial [Alicyclobacillaceae bacterium I2511]
IKYVRLMKREIRSHSRYYAQLVCEGTPYHKPEHTIGNETIGLDIGPSTIAIVGDTQATLTQFADEVVRDHKKIRRLQRK